MPRQGSSGSFVGRQDELGRLERALERATAGAPTLVLVTGEAGAGKSRLMTQFAASAATMGAMVLSGACLDLQVGGVPYAPFAEALRGWWRATTPGQAVDRAAIVGPDAAVLAALVPSIGTDRPPVDPDRRVADDPDLRIARLFDAVIDTLGRMAAVVPVVFIVEDIHWADPSTRDLIRFLVRNVRDERLLLVATFRSDDLHRRHPAQPLLAELARSERVERLDLRPFGTDEIRELAAALMGTPPPPTLVQSLLERSDGLPFYVEELVRTMVGDDLSLPESVRGIVGQRLGRLDASTLGVVRAAAVIGDRIDAETLAAVVDVDQPALDAAVHVAIDASILRSTDGPDGPGLAFHHVLVREAAEDDLTSLERMRMHRRVADHLEAIDPVEPARTAEHAAAIARHADASHDPARAFRWSVRAVLALEAGVAYRAALVHAQRALELWPQVPDPEIAAGIDRRRLLVLAARCAASGNRHREALEYLETAIADLRDDEPGRDATEHALQLERWQCAWEAYDFVTASAAVSRARSLGRDLSPEAELSDLIAFGSDRWWDEHLRESVVILERAVALAAHLGDTRSWGEAMSALAHTRADLGQAVQASQLLDASADAMRIGRDQFNAVFSWGDRTVALVTIGRFRDGEQAAAEALEIAGRYGFDERIAHYLRASVVDARFELGEIAGIDEMAAPVLAGDGVPHSIDWMRTTMARVATRAGDLERARQLLASIDDRTGFAGGPTYQLLALVDLEAASYRSRELIRIVDEMLPRLSEESAMPAWQILALGIRGAGDAAAAARRRRRTAEAEAAAAAASRWLEALRVIVDRGRAEGGPGTWAEAGWLTAIADADRAQGRLSAGDWQTIVETWSAFPHPYEATVARLRFAEACLRAGARADAAVALQAAAETALRIEARPLLAAIKALAAEARIALDDASPARERPATDSSGPPILTPREAAVLRLVAAGHTNREIGDQLFISEKTVSVHISNVMAKLGALSRYEAASEATRLAMI